MVSPRTLARKRERWGSLRIYVCKVCRRPGGTLETHVLGGYVHRDCLERRQRATAG